jgi:MFS family permease
MSFELRPLSMGELLDRSFSIYRRRPTLFLGIMAVPTVFALGLGLVVTLMTVGRPGFNGQPFDPNQLPSPSLIAGLAVGYVVFTVLYGAAYLLSLGATAAAVSSLYLDRETTIGDAYRHVHGMTGRLMLLGLLLSLRMLLVGLVVAALVVAAAAAMAVSPVVGGLLMVVAFICFVAAFVLMIFLMLRYSLAVPALVLEQSRASAAIKRSIALTRGNLGRLLLLGVCASVLTYAALAIFQAPFSAGAAYAGPGTPAAFWLTMAGVVSGTVGNLLAAPVLIIGLVVVYYDVRIRREALDVQMKMLALDAGESAPISAAAPLSPGPGPASGPAPGAAPGV